MKSINLHKVEHRISKTHKVFFIRYETSFDLNMISIWYSNSNEIIEKRAQHKNNFKTHQFLY